ncbi:MAG: anti-sigma factor domain-containing protein [Caldilineaceae bacterium]
MRELLEEYALGLLTPEQQQQVAAHLAGCPDCRAIAQEYADQLATLPEALAAVSPHQLPTALKARLLQRLETGAANGLDNSLLRPLFPDSTPIKPTLPPAVACPAPDLHLGIRRLRWALAVATILLVFTLAWSIRWNVALTRERALRTEFVELVRHQHELVLEIVDSGKTTRRVLRSTSESSNAYGKVFTRSDMAYVVAMATRLPQPPPGQAYHLWLVRGDQTELAGMMKINQEGFALVIYEADQHDPIYDRAYVTLQPQGSATPEGAPVIAWQAEE